MPATSAGMTVQEANPVGLSCLPAPGLAAPGGIRSLGYTDEHPVRLGRMIHPNSHLGSRARHWCLQDCFMEDCPYSDHLARSLQLTFKRGIVP